MRKDVRIISYVALQYYAEYCEKLKEECQRVEDLDKAHFWHEEAGRAKNAAEYITQHRR